MRSRLIALLLCAGALILACGPRAHSNEAASNTSQQRHADDSAKVLATSLNVSVERGVQFALHVTNNSEKGIELRFPSSQTHDFIVLDSIGREIWRWAGARMFTQAMQTKMLGARETMKVEEDWNPAGRKGTYTVVAKLTSGNHPLEEKVEFALP
jgi:intracellular proteinase inhibitor BsuPI